MEYLEDCETFLDASSATSSPLSSMLGLSGLGLDGELDRDLCSSSGFADGPLSSSLPSVPIQILPHLYLGCAKVSANLDLLGQHVIEYILNVAPNLPNVFEHDGYFKYKQIPIVDHWSQNLTHSLGDGTSLELSARGMWASVVHMKSVPCDLQRKPSPDGLSPVALPCRRQPLSHCCRHLTDAEAEPVTQ
uniref:Uncharacterized protein n=1 Tax=Electrophorus electricus TaxID=8005 RepID=A0A4W4F6B8_ELEEL